MGKKDNVFVFKKPEEPADLLTQTLRAGARKLLAVAIEAEVDEFLSQHNPEGSKARFVRNGYLPERAIQSGIGEIPVEIPRVRDRQPTDDGLKLFLRLCQSICAAPRA